MLPDAEAKTGAAMAAAPPPALPDDFSSRPALKTADLHPLLLDNAAEASPGPSPTVGRPLWSQRVEAPVISGPSRYFDLKGLQEKLETMQRAAATPASQVMGQADGGGSDVSSLRASGTEDTTDDEVDTNDPSLVSSYGGPHGGDHDDSSAEFAAIVSSRTTRSPANGGNNNNNNNNNITHNGKRSITNIGKRSRFPPLVAPQPRTPLGFQASSRSASQTPQPATARQTRASSRASQRQGALSPFGRAAAPEDRQIARTPSAFATVADPDDEELAGPSIDVLAGLHAMPESDLSQFLGIGAAAAASITSRHDKQFDAAASSRNSPRPRHLTQTTADAPDNAPTTPKAASFTPSSSSALSSSRTQARTYALVRSLSSALAEVLRDVTKAKASAIKERAKNQEAVEYMNQQHQSRESALKELCLQHGIKEGEISRCLLRAPVFDAEATKKRIESHAQTLAMPRPLASEGAIRISGGGERARDPVPANKAVVPVASLPQSIQEAMLEELEGAYGTSLGEGTPTMSTASQTGGGGGSRDRSPSVTSFQTDVSASSFNHWLRRADGKTHGSQADLRTEISSIASSSRSPITPHSPGKPSKLSRPPAVRSSSSASTTYRTASTTGLGEWASGLMPWAASGASRKAAASTASSNVKATSPGRHTISEGLLSDEPDPFETPIKSKSTTALPDESVKAADDAAAVEETASLHARSRSTSVPRMDLPEANRPPSRSGLGIFGTLAWRRKKPQVEQSVPSETLPEEGLPNDHAEEQPSVNTVKPVGSDSEPPLGEVATAGGTVDAALDTPIPDKTQQDAGEADLSAIVMDRPIAIRRSSSKSMPVALHEAIGSEPTSPLTEKLQVQLGLPSGVLPKPTHFKAIFLATRIMTPDASSLLYDSGKKTSELIASLAVSLVGRARDEGKIVEEPSRAIGGRRTSGLAPRPMSMVHAMLTQTVEDQAKRAPPGSQAGPSSTAALKAISSTTFARAFGRYTRSPTKDNAGQPVEPNVTRLPDTYRFTAAYAPGPATPGGAEHTQDSDSPLGLQRPPLAAVELEAIVPSEVAPPTLAKKRSRKKAQRKATTLAPVRKSAANARPGRLDSLDEEESSGDEFEVYGGKGPAAGYGRQPETEDADEDEDVDEETDSGDDAELLTDRYGFIYDATPVDIRLLRQARKAATPAPACLTGIRVGVRARGGTDSQSEEEKEGKDLTELDTEDERMDVNPGVPVDGDPTIDNADIASESGSFATTGDASTPSDGDDLSGSAKKPTKMDKSKKGLLSLSHSKPVAEALSVSVTSHPTSTGKRARPGQLAATASTTAGVSGPSRWATSKAATKLPTSQTVRRLLGQLQAMHKTQQTANKAKWDDFLERRRERLSRANIDSANGQPDGGAGSVSHARHNSTSSSSQQRFGIAVLASSEKAPEEDWSQGMVGINRMGASKEGKEDWRHFLSLCQAGIPLCYRAKIWAECSGANEVHEPGRYQELLNEHQGETNQCLTQIDLDVHRTMPTNIFFGGDGQGMPKLRRLLVAFSWYNPACGYCQGMNNLAATLLLTHATEEEAFWVLVCIIEKILPSEYYTSHLLVSQADQRVLIELVDELMPSLSAHIANLGVDLPAVTFAWFLSLYTDCLPVDTLFRVWDVMFVEGMVILFRVAIAVLKMNETELLATTSAAAFYGQVHSMTSRLFSVDRLIKLACEDLKQSIRYAVILEKRERHVADLTRELGLDA